MKFAKTVVFSSLVLTFLLTTSAAFADSTDYSNSGGTLSGTNAGLTLTGSTLIAVVDLTTGTTVTGSLGTVEFSTGALTGGSLQMGGTLAAGGSFTITGNGTGGIGNGVLFSGSFSGPVSWTLTTLANGTHNYTLSGVVTGMMGGVNVSGVTVQLTVNTGKGFFDGSIGISGGDTTIGSVPEPSTLALFGTGAISFIGTLRRKFLTR